MAIHERWVKLEITMVRQWAVLIYLLAGSACSEQASGIDACALPLTQEMKGTALLATGIDSEGRINVTVFRDKCSPNLKNVYYKAEEFTEVTTSMSAFPGRQIDGVKVGIIDANIRSLSAPNLGASDPIILIDQIYSVREYNDPTFAGS